MRLAFVNQDPGIDPGRAKGAAVHLRAMRAALGALSVEVLAFDEPDEATLTAALEEAHARAPFDGVYERYALAKRAGSCFARAKAVPHVLELNAPLADEEARWRGGAAAGRERTPEAEAEVLSHARSVVCVSSLVADYARARGARPETVVVFPNGVDTRAFRPRRRGDATRARLVPAGRVALGFHGRLRPWHGFEAIVAATARLLDEGHDVHLVLAGAGPFEQALDGRLPAERVTRLEWVPHEEMPAVVASFDVLPLAYAPEHPCYFSPLKLAEAMACGAVPVVPRLGDLPAVVTHGVSGLVFRPGDPEAMCAALRGVVADAEERARLGRGALAAARELGWERIAAFVRGVLAHQDAAR